MKRHEILFRGKRVSDGGWIKGDLIREPWGCFIQYHSAGIRCKDKVDPTTVGEYTGLCDRLGTPIFEGDILKWNEREWGCPFSEVADWDYGLLDARKRDWKEWCEIIGNIHDSPELVEVKR